MKRHNSTLLLALLTALVLPCTRGLTQDLTAFQTTVPPPNGIWLDSLDLSKATQDYGTPAAGKTVVGNPLTLAGNVIPHGFGTHAASVLYIDLHAEAKKFESLVGVDDEAVGGNPSIVFSVIGDGHVLSISPVMHLRDKPYLISADVTGVKTIVLDAQNASDSISYDHADWAGAFITLAVGATSSPQTINRPVEIPRMSLVAVSDRPVIHGPRIVGESVGKPFLFLISATGKRPLMYSAQKLPAGLSLSSTTGIISGALTVAGRTHVFLTVKGNAGTAHRELIIVGGAHCLALTPPMGWNSWYVWGSSVSQDEVATAARDMVSSGLSEHGYQYIDIDDGWAGERDSTGHIVANDKFPSMQALSSAIHAYGLKFGIYSSPGPQTCAGFTGSYQNEASDARTYSDWGVDFLKYDWCSYGSVVPNPTLPGFQQPYQLMSDEVQKQPRDMVFNLCQYGMGNVWTWGAAVGGNAWRVSGDSGDQWDNIHGEYETEVGLSKYAGPGHWNDPDYLMLGYVGFGKTRPTRLSPNEQIVQMSMWSLLSAPLFISSDMAELTPQTVALLSNDEVLDIDQDPLGKEANRISTVNGGEVWSRQLFDGTVAVGLVNTTLGTQTISVSWPSLGIRGTQPVRDLWLHKNVGSFTKSYSVSVPAHAIVLVKIGKPNV